MNQHNLALAAFKRAEALQQAIDAKTSERDRLIDNLLTEEQRAAVADIHAEFNADIAELSKEFERVKKDVKLGGESIKGSVLHYIVGKSGDGWNSSGLFALAATMPDIMTCYFQTDPPKRVQRVKK